MNAAVRSGALAALLVLAAACTNGGPPTAPTTDSTSTPLRGAVDVPRGFPAVSGPARIYVAAVSPSYPMHGSPLGSRYVLYDDGTFALQYSSANYPFFEYRGTYQEANALVTFAWEGWSTAGPWGASGSLSADALAVRYNLVMQMSDFEDGVYVRTE